MDDICDIVMELENVIRELESIENSLRYDFKGIYSNGCANIISEKIECFYSAKNKLNNIDRSRKD